MTSLIPFGPGQPLKESLGAIPDAAKAQMKAGFERLRRGDIDIGTLVDASVEYVDAVFVNTTEFTAKHREIPLKREEVRPALSAVSLMGVVLTNEDMSDEGLVGELIAAGLASQIDTNVMLLIAAAIRQRRDTFIRAQARARLSQAVLPSFRDLQLAVDVRVRTKGDAVSLAVPVAVGMLRTDIGAPDQIWFQASKNDLERIASEVTRALRAIDAAQRWADKERP